MRDEMKDCVKDEVKRIILKWDLKCFIRHFRGTVDLYNVFKYIPVSEDFIREFEHDVYWDAISMYQNLSEDFIKEFQNKCDRELVCSYQNLSEEFIREFQDIVDWDAVSKHQKLSENFIREFKDKVDWDYISIYQKLSEDFIREFMDKFHMGYISRYQKLSKSFIKEFKLKFSREFQDIVDWDEDFIKEFQNKCDRELVCSYQNLSEEFIDVSWLYKSKKFKLDYIKNNTDYEVIDDKYLIAFKTVRQDNYSAYNFQYRYFEGNIYQAHCDYSIDVENSFGLSAWTRAKAIDYLPDGKLFKVKINIEDVGAIVHESKKIRCQKLEILEEI